MDLLLLILLAVNVATLVGVTILYRRAKKARQVRRVEAPNSEYSSRYVMDLEARQRWEELDRSLLHEINREEFDRLLAKARATSVRNLTETERSFLDRMVEAERRVRRTRRRADGQGAGPAPSVS